MQARKKPYGSESFQPWPGFAKIVFGLALCLFTCTFFSTAISFLPILNYGNNGIILTPESLSIDGLTLYLLLPLCGLAAIGAFVALMAGLRNARQSSDNRAGRSFLPWSLALLCLALFALTIFMTVYRGCPTQLPHTGGSGDDIWYCSWTFPWHSPLHP